MDTKLTQHSLQDNNTILLEDAEIALEKLAHQEVQLIKEAEELFKRQVDHIRLIDNLQTYIPNMEKINLDTKSLSSLVESSSTLVEDVCSKIRRIDLAKARLEDCLSKVGDILDLKTCRIGMLKAMATNNYEEAAMHIKRFLSIDQAELHKTISVIYGDQEDRQPKKSYPLFDTESEKIEPIADYDEEQTVVDPKFMERALQELDNARVRLLQLCQENLTRAIKEDDKKDIERFFKIFPMLNEHRDGLNRYADYLRSKIVTPQVDDIFKSKKTNQADKLAALYESIAKLIDAHQPLIETYYGPGQLIVVVENLQNECGRLSRKILEEFRNETKLPYVVKVVKRSSMQAAAQASMNSSQANMPDLSPSKLDPRDIDNILNEIATIISRSEVYLMFIIQRLKDDLSSKCENDIQRQASTLELYNLVYVECELNDLVQQVSDIYVLLEEFYLNESSKKAITMDQIDVEGSKCFISSMLDDIFFIINKSTKRAISTKNNQVFCAIINNCVTLLESTFCQVLDDRLKNQQYYSAFTSKNLDLSQAYNAIQSGRYLQSASELEISKAQYFSALNNLDKACDYIKTLRKILDTDVKKLKPSPLIMDKHQDNQIEKSLTCLNELPQLSNRFMSIINSSLYQLFNSSLRNRLRSELKNIMNDNPDLTTRPDEVVSLAESLLATLDLTLKESLTSDNHSRLVSITKEFLASYIKTLK